MMERTPLADVQPGAAERHGLPAEQRSPAPAHLPLTSAELLRALAEPALLVTSHGHIVAHSEAFGTLRGVKDGGLLGARLQSMVDNPTAIDRLLDACGRTRAPLPGAMQLRKDRDAVSPNSQAGGRRLGVTGVLARPADGNAPALILLRVRVHDGPSAVFSQLNTRLAEVTRELQRRRTAELALMKMNERLEEQARELELAYRQLQDQATELEQQAETAQELAEELERSNAGLMRVNDELIEQRRVAERARDEAAEANRSKSDFLAIMSHELRTPLNAIGGYVELLQIGVYGPMTEQQRHSLERVQLAQRRLLVLINDVLTFARIEVGRIQYAMEAVSVASILRALESVVTPQLQQKGLQYECVMPDSDISVWGDRDRIEQILLNLVSNAIKFTPAGGRLTLAAAPDGDSVRISVADTGIGMSADTLERIFEPFVQLRPSGGGQRDGVGLGLAISREMAHGMNGTLTVQSTLGRGTTFELTLPRA